MRCMLEYAEIVVREFLKLILVRVQKTKRRAIEKASVFLRHIYIIICRMSIEMWMVKTILMRSQMETRNMLLDNGKKTIFAVN